MSDPLPQDLEDKLARIKEIRETQEELKTEYEQLRDEVTGELEGNPVIFVGVDGKKYRASYSRSAKTIVDLERARELLDDEQFDEITEIKVVNDKLKHLVELYDDSNPSGLSISPTVAAQFTRFIPGTPFPKIDELE